MCFNILVFIASELLERNRCADMNFYDKFGLQKTFGIACVANNPFDRDLYLNKLTLLMSSAVHHEALFLVGNQQAPA